MTKERQWAINMARFETARIEWQNDPQEAKKIMLTVNNTLGRFLPKGDSAPFRYRLIYFLFGFRVAEIIAQRLRGSN